MKRLATYCFCIVLVSVCSPAQGNKGKGKGHQKQSNGSSAVVDIRFGRNDVYAIQQYYRAHPISLPPGLQRRLSKGKPLPPGWQKKVQPFPSELAVQLGTPCGQCGYGVVNGYGVVYDKKTAIVLDVVQLAADILR